MKPPHVLPLLFFLMGPVIASDSGGYRGPWNNGVYPEAGLLQSWPEGGPKLLWKRPLEQGYAGVAVVSGTVYVASGMANTLAVYTLDGEPMYAIPTTNAAWSRFGGTRSTPLVDGDIVVTTVPRADVIGVDLQTRSVRWTVNAWKSFGEGKGKMGWGLPESPMQHDGAVIFNTCSRSDGTPPLVAVDMQTGRTVWSAAAGRSGRRYSAGDVSGACFRHNGRDFVVHPTWRFLLCVEARTGKRVWEIPDVSEKTLTPCYENGRLLWGPSGRVQMLRLSPDGRSYNILWTRHGGVVGFSHAVALNDRVYLFGDPWMTPRPAAQQPDAVTDEGIGYVAGAPTDADVPPDVRTNSPKAIADWKANAARACHLLCLDAETGKMLQSRPAGDPGHIVAADGMVYVLDLVRPGTNDVIVPRVSLIRPTATGFDAAGTLVPPFDPEELRWDSERRARNTQTRQWAREDFLYQKNVNPVIAEGRLFLRYGPLQVYDLRGPAWKSVPGNPAHGVPPDTTPDAVARVAAAAPQKVQPLLAVFASRFEDERTNAVAALAALDAEPREALLPILVGLLGVEGDRAWPVQSAAAAVLQTNGPLAASTAPALQERLVAAVSSCDAGLAELLMATVEAVSPGSMAGASMAVAGLLRHGDARVRVLAAETLAGVASDAAPSAAALAECLVSEDRRLAAAAAAALRIMGSAGASAVPVLQTGLVAALSERKSALADLTAGVLLAVDSNGLAHAASRMGGVLSHDDPRVVALTLRMLNRANASLPPAVPQLVRALHSPDANASGEAAKMLTRMGPEAVAGVGDLATLVDAGKGPLAAVAAGVLGAIGPAAAPAVGPLNASLLSTNRALVRASAIALGTIGPASAPAVSNLCALAGERDGDVVRCAVVALGAIGREAVAAAPVLLRALAHPDGLVRESAVASLRQVGADPVPALRAVVAGPDAQRRVWAAQALGGLGPEARAAAPVLADALKARSNPHLVRAAAEALGRIGKDATPAVPELLAASVGADRGLTDVIQRALRDVKTRNWAPTVEDVRVRCEEGKSIRIELPARDVDDVAGVVVSDILQGPANGQVTREGNTAFLYTGTPGWLGVDVLTWCARDPVHTSRTALATIELGPDITPPRLERAVAWSDPPEVTLGFDEPVAADRPDRYRIEPAVAVTGLTASADGRTVRLRTGPMAEGRSYTVSFAGIADRSRAANRLTTNAVVTYARLVPGIRYTYYETVPADGDWQTFAALKPVTNGIAATISQASRKRPDNYALRFEGFIRAPAPGRYTFSLNSDDGSRLYVGTNLVVNNDGMHGPQEVAGSVDLSAGDHPIRVTFYQGGGPDLLEAYWVVPGGTRQPIPRDAFLTSPAP
jgi:outer membrane protein assembly factor BamB